jgi:hypothetical protein
MEDNLLKAKSYAEEQLEHTIQISSFDDITQYLNYYDTHPISDDCTRFFRAYLRMSYWVGICIKDEGIKRGMKRDLDVMCEI